jgi:serine phosphatase RsbU (regulator of sigma subunit)
LASALVKAQKNDSAEYKALIQEYESNKNINPAKAMSALDRLEKLSFQKNNLFFYSDALMKKGILYYFGSKYDSSEYYATQALNAAKASDNNKTLMRASNLLGAICYNKGDFECSEKYYQEKVRIAQQMKDTASEFETYYNISLVLFQQGQYYKAAESDFKSLNYFEKKKDTINIVLALHGIGYIYMFLEDHIGAHYYFNRALQLARLMHDNNEVTALYIDMADFYEKTKRNDSASYFIDQAMKLAAKEKDEYHFVIASNAKAMMYLKAGNYSQGLILSREAEKLDLKADRKVSLGEIYETMARIYNAQNLADSAVKYAYKAYAIAQMLNKPTILQNCARILSTGYERMRNNDSAFKYYKMYSRFNDTLQKSSQLRNIGQKEFLYEKQKQESLRYMEQVRAQDEIKRQKQVSFIVTVASVLLLIFLVMGIINYMQKQRANAEVLRQKKLLEEKNKEVADSINYASRIQKSIMPDEKTISELMPNGFVLYIPKDIVSGDFYWINNFHDANGKVHHLMAVADCTGHGVPGAFMSLIGATILNQTLNNPGISDPAEALDYLNIQLPKNIKSSSASGTIKDGMEISMCEYDAENLKMQFAGANNNLYLVRNGALQLIKGDKRPIGQGYENLGDKFSNQQIQLQKGDAIYMSSDGFPDQFGGPKGKKFKYKQMEEIFLEIHELPVNEQREILKKRFIDWKGELDQVDDVCIIGIKI